MSTDTGSLFVRSIEEIAPDFDQTVVSMVANGETTLDRLAVLGIITQTQVDYYEKMFEPLVIVGEVLPLQPVSFDGLTDDEVLEIRKMMVDGDVDPEWGVFGKDWDWKFDDNSAPAGDSAGSNDDGAGDA